MIRERLRRLAARARALPVPARLAGLGLVLLLLYLPMVALVEEREEARLERLSESAPARFLDLERSRHGMGAYLDALAELRGFDRWRDSAPTFLIGAWALPGPEDEGGKPGLHCLSGIVIEDGRVRWFGSRREVAAARYRIDHGEIQIALRDGQVLQVQVPRHLAGERRIDLAVPGRPTPLHGYRCL